MTLISQVFCLKPEKFENNFKESVSLKFVSLCLLSMLSMSNAHADGTLAGTDISNIVIVNYKINGDQQTPIESSPNGNTIPGVGNGQVTKFKVDRKVDLSVTGATNTNVIPGEIQSTTTFTLLNEGNDIQEFQLLPDGSVATDEFDTTACTTSVTAVINPSSPLAGVVLPTSGNIKLAPDQKANISVKCNIPADNAGTPIVTGDTSLISLTAIAEKNSDGSTVIQDNSIDTELGIETTFADSAGSDDISRDAAHSARSTYIASVGTATPPTLNINKNIIDVRDPNGGNTTITNSEITYQIKISTTGVGVINDVVVTDATPTGMNYKPASIKLDNVALTDVNSDNDKADFGVTSSNTATINLGNITAGSQYEIQLTYIVN